MHKPPINPREVIRVKYIQLHRLLQHIGFAPRSQHILLQRKLGKALIILPNARKILVDLLKTSILNEIADNFVNQRFVPLFFKPKKLSLNKHRV